MKNNPDIIQEICPGIFIPFGENPQIYKLNSSLLIPIYWWAMNPDVYAEFRQELDPVLNKWFTPKGLNTHHWNMRHFEISARTNSHYAEILARIRAAENNKDQHEK